MVIATPYSYMSILMVTLISLSCQDIFDTEEKYIIFLTALNTAIT